MTEVVRIPTTEIRKANQAIVTWAGLDGDDSGKAIDVSQFTDKTVHIYGTFDSASVTLYGSNDEAAVLEDMRAGTLFGSKTASWIALTDPQANAITKTAAAIEAILENPLYILPVVTGGGGSTNLKVVLNGRKVI